MPSFARPIYLDHNATTPLRAEVKAALVASLDEPWANPSSVHRLGRKARDAIESARGEVAALLGADPDEIVFTSGGTEGNHLCLRGLGRRRRGAADRPPRVLSSAIEHPSVHGALDELVRGGAAVGLLPVTEAGVVTVDGLRETIDDDVTLVSVGMANHEIGTINDVAALAALAHERGALFHTDAVQAAGRVPLDVGRFAVDAATMSAHKLGGPKGVGAVFVRRGLDLAPLFAGGHQERERRPGTENVSGIVGFGVACRLARVNAEGEAARIARLRDRLEGRLLEIPGARRHGDPARRVPGTTNVGFAGADGQLVLIGLDLEGICVSTGAACTAGSVAPSPVLLALGLSPEQARQAVRFSVGPGNTEDEIDRAAAVTAAVVARVRAAAADGPQP